MANKHKKSSNLIVSLFKHIILGIRIILYIIVYTIQNFGFILTYICYSVFCFFRYCFFTFKYPILVLKHKQDYKAYKSELKQKRIIRDKERKAKLEEKIKNRKEDSSKSIDDFLLKYVSDQSIKYKEKYDLMLKRAKDREYTIKKPKADLKNLKPTKKKKKSLFKSFSERLSKLFKSNTFAKNKQNKKELKRNALMINFEGADAIKSEKKLLYQYIARDPNGQIVKDYFNAYSKVEVHSYLLSEGYEVYSIKTNALIQLLHSRQNTNKTKIKNKDLIFFLTQLSTYLKAGIPLVEALKIIGRQYKNKKYKKIFRSVVYELSIGESFSNAIEKQSPAFPKLLCNMVKTAEMTGSLPEVLDDMADYYTEAEESRRQMITAMTYPSIVFVFAIGVMVFIMIYVVPRFVDIYDTMDTEVPLITKVVLAISSSLQHFWYLYILGVALFIGIIIFLYKKFVGFKTRVQWLLMHMPVFKNVIIYNEVTMFTKTFGQLLQHNVPITDSMEILNKITNNEIYKMLILDTITNLAKGGKISESFKGHWAFPIPAYEMIVTGEMTGELAEMMHKVSIYYQDLHKNAVTRIKSFIEPALTIFLTVGVGFILLSIIIPMFNMYTAVQDME